MTSANAMARRGRFAAPSICGSRWRPTPTPTTPRRSSKTTSKSSCGNWRTRRRAPDADRFAATVEADMLRGAYVDPARGKMTLVEYVEKRWKPAQHHLVSGTLETYDRHWRNRIRPRLGDRQLGSLTRGDTKNFVAEIKGTVGTSTLHTTFATLRIFMQAAVDDELIVANPCTRVKLPPIEDRELTMFSAEQVWALADAISPRYRLAMIPAVGAGLRQCPG
ncbi:N-terminal phage integrase SAM-like domain-containing protein, partial [Allosalinactinospora lopnorensis]